MKNKKFLVGVLCGILISTFSMVGLLYFALNNRNMRLLTYDIAKKLSTLPKVTEDKNTVSSIDWSRVLNKEEELYKAINSYYLEKVDNKKLEDGMYKGMVDSLGDPYTVYYNKKEFEEFNNASSGTYYGIGVLVSQNVSTGAITVVKTFKNGSGKKEGLKPLDEIIKVNGESIEKLELSQVVSKIKGEEGTFVNITVLRDGKEIDFNLERKKIEIDTVFTEERDIAGKKIGYVSVSEFDKVTEGQFNDAINEFERDDIKGIIIDLRDNPGGLLDVTCNMLDRLLPKGELVYTIDKNGEKEVEEAINDDSFDKPIVILINKNSASAAEVFSGTMKDYKRATLVGEKTFGKGIVQSIVPFPDGTAIKVTVSKYYTPSGINIHGIGIEPDVEVKDKRDKKKDLILDKGISVLLEKISNLDK